MGMAPNEVVVLRRWQVLAAFVLLTLGATGVAFWNGYRIDQAEKRIQRNTQLAIVAHAKATQAKDDVDFFKGRLQREQVCTRSNRGIPCRALFQRLAEDISPKQRLDLACEVAKDLQLPQYKVFCVSD